MCIRDSTNLTVPSAGGGNADIELANIADLTCTDITFTDDLIGPDAYFSNDVDSDGLTTRYIGSKYPATPGSEAQQLTIFANAGIYTCIVGYAATIERINMVPGGDGLCAPKLTADVGIITALNAGATGSMSIDAGSAGQIKSFQFESVATNVPPIKTSSQVKCVNLNADLLDGLTTYDSNWTAANGASIMSRDSNGSTKVKDITATGIFQGGSGAFPNGITGADATITGTNSISNLTVTGSFSAATGTEFAGNSNTATTATNVVGGANRIPYNSASNITTTDDDLQFNGTKMTVKDLDVTGSFTANIAALVPSLATNVAGGAGRVIYNSATNTTATSSNLSFDGTNLTVGGDITAFASDMRLKTNIEQIEGAVAKVCKLSGFVYEFNEVGRELQLPKGRHAGVSAQEVETVLPEAVTKRPNDKFLTVKYEKLVPLLIEAIKELKSEIDDLKSQ